MDETENNNHVDNNGRPDQDCDVKQSDPASYVLADFLVSMVKATLVLIVAITVFFRYATVFGYSMLPTFDNGDLVIAENVFYTPKHGDVVAVFDAKVLHKPLIKRVIGLPGDVITIDGQEGVVYRNGSELLEKYTYERTYETGNISYPVTVPENCVFVMGDNRNDSSDSRISDIGMIDYSRIIGKVVLRFYPFSEMEIF